MRRAGAGRGGFRSSASSEKVLQGYLAHKKQRPPRTLQQEHA